MYIDGSWAVTTFETMNPDLNFNCTAIPAITTDDFWVAGTVDIAQEFSDGDKNPTLIQGVEYNVPQLKEINDYINEGRFAPSLASIWTQDLRNSLVVSVQALILDKDVDTFLDEFQSLVEEYYTPAESES